MPAIVPKWHPAVAGVAANASDVNQLLVDHQAVVSYGGTQQAASGPGGAVYDASYLQWSAMAFQTGASQTSIGYVELQISTVGGSSLADTIPELTVSLYTDLFGTPLAAVSSATVSSVYVYSQPFWATIPLAASGLSPATTYFIVAEMTGDASHYYAWQHDTSAVGAQTSPDGLAWTDQTYGLMYRVFDQSGGTGQLPLIVSEDDGNRVNSLGYNLDGSLASIGTYTTSDAGTVNYSAALTYTNGLLTGVG